MKGKVVLVTGVTAGIGLAIAETFAERGADVVGCGRRNDKGRIVESRIRDRGGKFTFIQADVTRRDDCRRFVREAIDLHGRVDVLINNAGGGGELQRTADLDEHQFDAVLRLNLHSAMFCSQAVIPAMRSNSTGGVILNIASVQGLIALAGTAGYGAAKAGLIQLTRTLAIEHIVDGIRANIIVMGGAPTAAAAAITRQINILVNGQAPATPPQHLPLPLTGTPVRDIATALCGLADDDMRAVTGAVIAIDQGQTAGSLYSDAVYQALAGHWSPQKGTSAAD